MPAARAPDFLEPVVGYRAWQLDADGALVPWSLSGSGAWVPGVNEAQCHIGAFGMHKPRRPHRPPGPGCMCGLYALARLGDSRLIGSGGQAVGAIVAWGEIELHRTGYRAAKAQIVALALSDDPAMAAPLLAAAERYGVPLVPREELPTIAAQFGASLDMDLLKPERAAARDAGRHLGERGVALLEHVWAQPGQNTVTLGITEKFVGLLGSNVEMTCAPVGTHVTAGDPLAMIETDGESLIVWSCLTGYVTERNEAMLATPRLLSSGIGGHWLSRVNDADWEQDAANFVWGKRGETSYAAQVDRRRTGEDVFSEIRAQRHFTGPPVASAADVLRELDLRRNRPAFADEADVYAQCAPLVRERLAGRPAMSRRLANRGVSLRCLTRAPDATMTIHAHDGRTVLTCGACPEPTDLTLDMPAATAKQLFGGQLDIVSALRRHEVTSSASLAQTLRSFSVLKDLFARSAAGAD